MVRVDGLSQVAKGTGPEALPAKAGTEPAHLAGTDSQQLRRSTNVQSPCLQSGQDLHLSLLFLVQGNCPHSLSMRTFSLSS